MIIPAQWRAARALLDWSQSDLARYLEAAASLIMRMETGHAPVPDELLKKAREAYEAGGVEFIGENGVGAGVRLRKAPQ